MSKYRRIKYEDRCQILEKSSRGRRPGDHYGCLRNLCPMEMSISASGRPILPRVSHTLSGAAAGSGADRITHRRRLACSRRYRIRQAASDCAREPKPT
jgi:hypothetical protein